MINVEVVLRGTFGLPDVTKVFLGVDSVNMDSYSRNWVISGTSGGAYFPQGDVKAISWRVVHQEVKPDEKGEGLVSGEKGN